MTAGCWSARGEAIGNIGTRPNRARSRCRAILATTFGPERCTVSGGRPDLRGRSHEIRRRDREGREQLFRLRPRPSRLRDDRADAGGNPRADPRSNRLPSRRHAPERRGGAGSDHALLRGRDRSGASAGRAARRTGRNGLTADKRTLDRRLGFSDKGSGPERPRTQSSQSTPAKPERPSMLLHTLHRPNCDKELRSAAGVEEGRKIKCPGCQESFAVAAPADGQEERPKAARTRGVQAGTGAARGKAARPPADEDEDDAPRRKRREDDEDEDEPRPRSKKGKNPAKASKLPVQLAVVGGAV